MGNSASNANNPPRPQRQPSASPGPGQPHRSMRTKKKSLELPDLASLSLSPATQPPTRGRQSKSANIPIPTVPPAPFNDYRDAQPDQPQRAPVHLPSTSDVSFQPPPAYQYQYIPTAGPTRANRHNQSAPRGRQQGIHIQQQAVRIQDLFDRSQHQHSAAPPSTPAGFSAIHEAAKPFKEEVVQSSIPNILLGKAPEAQAEVPAAGEPAQEDVLAEPAEIKIVWKGGGTDVVLARAGDDEWKGRTPMEREAPNSNVWTLKVFLHPGTHHVRFFVDGQWRVADDLPTAVDDQGSLANYVTVPLSYGAPPAPPPPVVAPPAPAPAPPPKKVIPGQSFWSTSSSKDEDDVPTSRDSVETRQARTNDGWTNIIPPELVEAAREEEAYVAASASPPPGGPITVTGFVPAPHSPPAPHLPRHLEKLILNSRVGEQRPPGSGGSNSGHGHAGGSSAAAPANLPGGVGSGQGGGRRERRERGDRGERSVRRRGNVAPPPTEVGDLAQDRDNEEGSQSAQGWSSSVQVPPPSAQTSSTQAPPAPPPSPPPQPGRYMPAQLLNLQNQPIRSAAAVEATLAAWGTSTPATAASGRNANGTSSSLPTSGSAGGPGGPNAASLASASGGTLASAVTPGGSGSGGTTPTGITPSGSGGMLASGGSPSSSSSAPQVSGSRAITIDDASMQPLTDDGSVLPAPVAAVLHHLCTSAIRNGVLAVGVSTRYREKFLTTIYYKPT